MTPEESSYLLMHDPTLASLKWAIKSNSSNSLSNSKKNKDSDLVFELDEFGRKRIKAAPHPADDPKSLVNYMKPKAPGYYSFSLVSREEKDQQIRNITSIQLNLLSLERKNPHRWNLIQAAKARNQQIHAIKHAKYIYSFNSAADDICPASLSGRK